MPSRNDAYLVLLSLTGQLDGVFAVSYSVGDLSPVFILRYGSRTFYMGRKFLAKIGKESHRSLVRLSHTHLQGRHGHLYTEVGACNHIAVKLHGHVILMLRAGMLARFWR